jgi:hypothetical protein
MRKSTSNTTVQQVSTAQVLVASFYLFAQLH